MPVRVRTFEPNIYITYPGTMAPPPIPGPWHKNSTDPKYDGWRNVTELAGEASQREPKLAGTTEPLREAGSSGFAFPR